MENCLSLLLSENKTRLLKLHEYELTQPEFEPGVLIHFESSFLLFSYLLWHLFIRYSFFLYLYI